MKNDQIELIEKELTFQPIILNKKFKRSLRDNIEDVLINSGKYTEEKIENLRINKIENEIKECTFHPEINNMYV